MEIQNAREIFKKRKKRIFPFNTVNLIISILALGVTAVFSILAYDLSKKVSKQDQTIKGFDSLLAKSNEQIDTLKSMAKTFVHVSESIDSQLSILNSNYLSDVKSTDLKSTRDKASIKRTLKNIESLLIFAYDDIMRSVRFETIDRKIKFFDDISSKLFLEMQNEYILSRPPLLREVEKVYEGARNERNKFEYMRITRDSDSFANETNEKTKVEMSKWIDIIRGVIKSL